MDFLKVLLQTHMLYLSFPEPFYDEFAIISDVTHDRLYQVGLSDAELRALDIPDVNVPVSVIYDKPTEKLYWSNAVRTEIRAAKLKATTSELIFDTCKIFKRIYTSNCLKRNRFELYYITLLFSLC